MRLLVVGSGGREHAISWKLGQSPLVEELHIAPGNAGTAQVGQNVPIAATDIARLLSFARDHRIDLTVVGPEVPLAAGIADRFQDAGLCIFGPTRDAARIESSKSFTKELMLRNGIPTGAAQVFQSYPAAVEYVQRCTVPVVVKADGLAAGKGVVVAQTRQEALYALRQQMEEKQLGAAGEQVLVEEFLQGQEVSVFAFVDGEYVSPMVAACDYKRAGDGDAGPNTGGMGSYSPPGFWTKALESQVRREIMEPTARALVARGSPFQGVLYAGLMVTEKGPKVLEFNCRLGDPEAQVVLPLLKTDLAAAMMGAAQGRLSDVSVQWDTRACVGVVVASGGYPGRYATGHPIEGLKGPDADVMVFHAGTKAVTGAGGAARVVTDGGRVLTVASLGTTLDEARRRVYASIGRIQFKDAFYRKDIAAPS